MPKVFIFICGLIAASVLAPAHAQLVYSESFQGEGLLYKALPTGCRIADSRQPTGGALANGQTRALTVLGIRDFSAQGGRDCGTQIPANAEAVVGSVSLLPTTGPAFLKVMPNGTPFQQGNTVAGQGSNLPGLNPAYGPVNDMIIKIKTGTAPHLDVYANTTGNPVHFVIDVTGYMYRPKVTCTGQVVTGAVIGPGQVGNTATAECPVNSAFGNGGCELTLATNTQNARMVSAGLRVNLITGKPFYNCRFHNVSATANIQPVATGVCCTIDND